MSRPLLHLDVSVCDCFSECDCTFASSTDPLCQTTTQPNITFYDEPKEETFTSSGGHADFNNGVEVTVPAYAVPQGSTVGVKVQPGFIPSDVTVMPEGIQSASPSYLISSDGSDGLKGEVNVTMEHHVKVSTREEANALVFLQADAHPTQSGVYQYREVSDGRSEFTPGRNKGRVHLKSLRKKFIKVGKKIKKWLKGMYKCMSFVGCASHLESAV